MGSLLDLLSSEWSGLSRYHELTIVMIIDDVAIMHSAIVVRNGTIVALRMVPVKHLHCSNAVSCNAWYTLLLEDSRRRSVLSAKALSMAKRRFEGAKPEVAIVPLTARDISCQKFHGRH